MDIRPPTSISVIGPNRDTLVYFQIFNEKNGQVRDFVLVMRCAQTWCNADWLTNQRKACESLGNTQKKTGIPNAGLLSILEGFDQQIADSYSCVIIATQL